MALKFLRTAIMAIQTNYSESRKFEEISSLLLPACVPANLEAIRSKLFGLHYSQKELFAGILMEKVICDDNAFQYSWLF